MKRLIAKFKSRKQIRYAIREEIHGEEVSYYIPVIKFPGLNSRWEQLCEIHGYFDIVVLNVDGESTLSKEMCLHIIDRHKLQMIELKRKVIYTEV